MLVQNLKPARYDVQADMWTTIGQMSDGTHWSTHGNLRAGNKFYLEAADRGHLAEFDPATETYQVIDSVSFTPIPCSSMLLAKFIFQTPACWMNGMALVYNGPIRPLE